MGYSVFNQSRWQPPPGGKMALYPTRCAHRILRVLTFERREPSASDGAPMDWRHFAEASSKHTMLSYNWDSQKQVLAIKQALQAHGIRCWMDVDGGMKQDIYDSMATAVQNAKVVCCFMTAKYQASANCRLELKVS